MQFCVKFLHSYGLSNKIYFCIRFFIDAISNENLIFFFRKTKRKIVENKKVINKFKIRKKVEIEIIKNSMKKIFLS